MFNFFRRKKSSDEIIETSVASPSETPADTLVENLSERVDESSVELLVESSIESSIEPSIESNIESNIEPSPIAEPSATPTDVDLGAIFTRAMNAGLSEAAEIPEFTEFNEPETQDRPTMEGESQGGWFARLRKGLSKTGTSLRHVFVGVRVDENLFESLEDALLMADVGVNATNQVMTQLRARIKRDKIEDAQGVQTALKHIVIELLQPLEKTLDIDAHQPLVLMVAGVNGAGKTTSIGKLSHHLQAMDKKIILAAGDTFRAAAREQLAVWGERNNVTVIAQESGDPAAVVFDAIASAQAKKLDVVIADTAGRLPTQLNLMDELKKVKRVADKAMSGAPHEIILVLDGNMGQNALAQVKAFDEAVGLTGWTQCWARCWTRCWTQQGAQRLTHQRAR